MTAVDVTLSGLGFPFGPAEEEDDRHVEDPQHMRSLAEQAAEELEDASAEDVIRWATDTFGDRICITSSMSDAVVIHLVSALKPGVDVLFLDTGYHFPETIGTRDAVSAIYPVNLVNVTPSRTVAEQDAELGPRLYGRNPDLCCYLRKVEPLEKSLAPYDAWFTGVRREETASRRDTRVVEWDEKRQMIKVNPIVEWTQQQVDVNLFQLYQEDLTVHTAVDAHSIMMYPIPKAFTLDGFEAPMNTALTDTDKTFMSTAYPF